MVGTLVATVTAEMPKYSCRNAVLAPQVVESSHASIITDPGINCTDNENLQAYVCTEVCRGSERKMVDEREGLKGIRDGEVSGG